MGYETRYKGKFKQIGDHLEKVAPGVTFPSDNMTPIEKASLSGPVHIYYIQPERRDKVEPSTT